MNDQAQRLKRRAKKRSDDWRLRTRQLALIDHIRNALPRSFKQLVLIAGLEVYSPAVIRTNLKRYLGFSVVELYGTKEHRVFTKTDDPFLWDWGLIFAVALHHELKARLRLRELGQSDWKTDIREAMSKINKLRGLAQ